MRLSARNARRAEEEALWPLKVLRRATAASSLEDGAFTLVLPVLAQQSTGNAGVAVVFVAVTAPWALASLPIGYLADHMSRTQLMRIVAFVRTGLAVLLAALYLFDNPMPAMIPAVAFGLGSCGVAADIARQSLVPQLVLDPDRFVSANTEIAKVSLLYGGFVGPLLGGWLLTLNEPVATTALAAFAAVTMVVTLGLPKTPALLDDPMRVRTMVSVGLEGFRHIYRRRTLLTLAALSFTVSAIWYVWETSFTAFALAGDGLDASSFTYSVLLLASAAGAVISTRAVRHATKTFPLRTVLSMSLAGWVLWFVTPALTSNWWAVIVCLVLGGGAGLLWNTVSMTARQLVTSGHLLGRTTAAYRMVTRSGRAVGAALAGVLMTHMSWQHIFALCAAVIGVVAVGIFALYRGRSMLEPEMR
ncbi:MFS transporter [Streptomyces sp. S.PNR 29]|uniref:MFS transporter n=1 Tax=Streptomyces sp. S.PNR 29 TaxID=2973805 RepID=UPI0025B11E10|nr:MFS transporter [Streptomyces sp. S.PNR 29]MDN0199189.1 MFS transporter [Streptomyces sp. S.PNR 29]